MQKAASPLENENTRARPLFTDDGESSFLKKVAGKDEEDGSTKKRNEVCLDGCLTGGPSTLYLSWPGIGREKSFIECEN